MLELIAACAKYQKGVHIHFSIEKKIILCSMKMIELDLDKLYLNVRYLEMRETLWI